MHDVTQAYWYFASDARAADSAALHPAVAESLPDAGLHDVQCLSVSSGDHRRRHRLLLFRLDTTSRPTIYRDVPLRTVLKNHRRRRSVNFGGGGARHFYPQNLCMKKWTKCPNFAWYLPEKLTACPNFTRYLPENARILRHVCPKKIFSHFFWGREGGGSSEPCLPVSYAKNQPESELRVDSFYPACNTL